MHNDRMQAIARSLALRASRRRLTSGATALALAALAGTDRVPERATAKKRKKRGGNKKKRDKKTCNGGTARCGKACVDLASDTGHCGACGIACGANAICDEGICRACDVCADGCAFSSVQAAINAAAPGDIIAICPGTYTDRSGTYEAFSIFQDLTLAGGTDTILQAKGERSVIWIWQGPNVTLRNLTITGGDSGSGGGGIDNLMSNVTLTNCTVRDNSASGGGGIFNREGSVTINGGSVRDNVASVGGGIANAGVLTLTNGALVTGNTATGSPNLYGGGISNEGAGVVTLTGGSRVTGNSPDNCIFTPACPA